MAWRTEDRSADVLTVQRIGATQELTPEGFLLCRDVPIARTGEMLYLPAEIGGSVQPGSDGICRIIRDDEALFRPETIASALGKSVVIDHPAEDVSPENWATHTVGMLLAIRQGEGDGRDLLVADLLITDKTAIAEVQAGLREISCGYHADYEDLGGGRGRQTNILFNHIALVARGRCGPRCSIGDEEMRTSDKKPSWKDRLRAAFSSGDQQAFSTTLDAMPEDGEGEGGEEKTEDAVEPATETADAAEGEDTATTDEAGEGGGDGEKTGDEEPPAWFVAHVKANDARFADLESRISGLSVTRDASAEEPVAEEKTEDAAAGEGGEGSSAEKTEDSGDLAAEFQDTVARAEILVPGIQLPTRDAALDATAQRDVLCRFRRQTLTQAAKGDHAATVGNVLLGRTVDSLTCDAVAIAFEVASNMASVHNNSQLATRGYVANTASKSGPPSIADINARNAAFWGGAQK